MKTFKSSVNRLREYFEKSRDKWKQKAIDRHKKIRALQIRVRDLEKSRDNWKSKAKNIDTDEKKVDLDKKRQSEHQDSIKTELKDPKKNNASKIIKGKETLEVNINQNNVDSNEDIKLINYSENSDEILEKFSSFQEDGKDNVKTTKAIEGELIRAPKGHTYSTQVILWSLQLLVDVYASLRGAVKTLALFSTFLGYKTPSYTSISNWGYRLGFYLLQQTVEYRNDWIIVIDETVELSKNKAFVILGITREKLKEVGYSPVHADMQVIDIRILTNANGDMIKSILEEVSSQIGVFYQIVSDHGSDIKTGVALYKQAHPETICTYDISHYVATLLKKELAKDERWLSFLSHCSQTSKQVQQTELSFLKPPKQRTKARFMHTETHLEWANDMIIFHERGDFSEINPLFSINWEVRDAIKRQFGTAVSNQLGTIHGRPFENKSAFHQALVEKIGKSKVNQFDEIIFQKASQGWRRWNEKFDWLFEYQDDLTLYRAMVKRTKLIQTHLKHEGLAQGAQIEMKKTFDLLSSTEPRVQRVEKAILQHVKEAEKGILGEQAVLASSDIIESVFGKYKFSTKDSPVKEVGKRILLIPVFLTQLGTTLVQKAMETVCNADVDQWAQEKCGTSMLAKSRKTLGNKVNNIT